MSAIVLYHAGTAVLPLHIWDCIAKIRQWSRDIPIYFIGDQAPGDPSIEPIFTNHPMFSGIEGIGDGYFPGDKNPLWRQSLLRLFYVQRLMEEYGLTDVLHFDNDVMLFCQPEEIIERFRGLYSRCAAASPSADAVGFGMGYLPSAEALSLVTDAILKEMAIPWPNLSAKYGGFPTEMAMLSAVGSVDLLPVLPSGEARYSNNFSEFGAVFDPSSYGQFIDGTDNEKVPGYFGIHHAIGRRIAAGMKVFMEDGEPWLEEDGKRVAILNLHVHSKRTARFL